jgi:hypothetical protein
MPVGYVWLIFICRIVRMSALTDTAVLVACCQTALILKHWLVATAASSTTQDAIATYHHSPRPRPPPSPPPPPPPTTTITTTTNHCHHQPLPLTTTTNDRAPDLHVRWGHPAGSEPLQASEEPIQRLAEEKIRSRRHVKWTSPRVCNRAKSVQESSESEDESM